MLLRSLTSSPVLYMLMILGSLVVDQSERVIASNVFEEMDFPTMSKGRVALLGDGIVLAIHPTQNST